MNKEYSPKDDLVDAISRFVGEKKREPKKAIIPREVALDFCKLGRDELGDLSQTLLTGGPDALNGKVLFGVEVIVPALSHDVDDIVVE